MRNAPQSVNPSEPPYATETNLCQPTHDGEHLLARPLLGQRGDMDR